MSDVAKWLREWWRVGRLPYEQGIVRDLVNLCTQQHEALSVENWCRWEKGLCADNNAYPESEWCPRCLALEAAEAFKEKYE